MSYEQWGSLHQVSDPLRRIIRLGSHREEVFVLASTTKGCWRLANRNSQGLARNTKRLAAQHGEILATR